LATSKVLIVDDRQQDLYFLEALLQGNGFRVATAGHGQAALAAARTDMIVSDILMPVMDGFTLCREWMKDEQLRSIPFVFYSATYTESRDAELATQLGAARFIVKPLEPDALIAALRDVLGAHASGVLDVHTLPPEDEPVFLTLYNERLVRRLEHKVTKLDEAYRHLAALYRASAGMAMNKSVSGSWRTLTRWWKRWAASAGYFAFDNHTQQFTLRGDRLRGAGAGRELAARPARSRAWSGWRAKRGSPRRRGDARRSAGRPATTRSVGDLHPGSLRAGVVRGDRHLQRHVPTLLRSRGARLDDAANNVAVAVRMRNSTRRSSSTPSGRVQVAARTANCRPRWNSASDDRLKSQFVAI
jgi:CheY-like chemotaxis protein